LDQGVHSGETLLVDRYEVVDYLLVVSICAKLFVTAPILEI
jgi:hypothetical protein